MLLEYPSCSVVTPASEVEHCCAEPNDKSAVIPPAEASTDSELTTDSGKQPREKGSPSEEGSSGTQPPSIATQADDERRAASVSIDMHAVHAGADQGGIRGMVLPFQPITVTFRDLHYFVPLPEVCPPPCVLKHVGLVRLCASISRILHHSHLPSPV